MLVWITKLDPKKFSNVELLIRIGILLSIKRSWNNVPFKCLNTIFKAMKCVWVSLYINWDNLLTIKLMSGLVCAKYYKEPNIFRNSSTSTGVIPSKSLKRAKVNRGVADSFAPNMFVRERMSLMYLCCVRKSFLPGIISTPRK